MEKNDFKINALVDDDDTNIYITNITQIFQLT